MKVHDILCLLSREVQGIGEEVWPALACGKDILYWNENLPLVVEGSVVRGSNIIELLKFILYPEEYDKENPDENIPKGFDKFLYGLRKIELESQWVWNARVIYALDNNDNGWGSDDSADADIDSDDGNKTGDDNEEASSWLLINGLIIVNRYIVTMSD